MTNSAFQFLGGFLSQIFRLFTSWFLPGTNVTPAGFVFFIAAASLSLRFIVYLFTGTNLISDDPKEIKASSKGGK